MKLLQLVGDPDRHRILKRLLAGAATQKELVSELKMNSGAVSRDMKILEAADLVWRERSHGPYELRFRHELLKLLQDAANLDTEIAQARAEAAKHAQRELNRAGMRVAGAPSAESGAR